MFRHVMVRKLEPAALQSQRSIMMRFYEIASIALFEHDLFGKPASTFPDHALKSSRRLFPGR
jgi:hypothetical protein